MNYESLAKELKKNIQVMETTFAANNLQVLNVGCKPCGDNDADLDVYVEIASISGSSLENDVDIKINLYDEDGELYMTDDTYVDSDTFAGYDTLTIQCYDSRHTLEQASKGRLYATRR